jgi:hypothetical protein
MNAISGRCRPAPAFSSARRSIRASDESQDRDGLLTSAPPLRSMSLSAGHQIEGLARLRFLDKALVDPVAPSRAGPGIATSEHGYLPVKRCPSACHHRGIAEFALCQA